VGGTGVHTELIQGSQMAVVFQGNMLSQNKQRAGIHRIENLLAGCRFFMLC